MSVEIGSQNKSIQYVSVFKESRSDDEFCSTDDRWSVPQLNNQADYLCAVSRFEVPMNRVPIVKAMKSCIPPTC